MWVYIQVSVTDPGFTRGASSGLPEKCVIWASEYNLGPQIWGPGGAWAPGPTPLDPLLSLHFVIHYTKCLSAKYRF